MATFAKGQKSVSAKRLNYMESAAKIVHDSQLLQMRNRNGEPLPMFPGMLQVKNISGESLWSYSVLAIKNAVLSEKEAEARSDALNSNVLLTGDIPSGNEDIVSITLSTVNQDEIVNAVVSGPTYCLINVVSTSHRYAVPIDGDCTKLESSDSGSIQILCETNKTGEHFLPILLGVSGTSKRVYAVVMETISLPPDPTQRPPDEEFIEAMGKVALFSRDYPEEDEEGNPIEPEYDDCACIELADTEVILKGDQVELDGPFSYMINNPDFNENEEESAENPKKIKKEYFRAINTLGEYTERLESDLTYDFASTITVKIGDEEAQFTVHCNKMPKDKKLASGSGVTVNRTLSSEGRILEVMLGSCPIDDEGEDLSG